MLWKLTRVTGLSGGGGGVSLRGELVTVVPDTDFELHLVLLLTNHVSLEEGGEQMVLVPTQVHLNGNEVNGLQVAVEMRQKSLRSYSLQDKYLLTMIMSTSLCSRSVIGSWSSGGFPMVVARSIRILPL